MFNTSPMTIIHGENLVSSRRKLVELLATARSVGQTTTTLHAKKTTRAELEQVLGASGLFGQTQLLVVEELHSLPNSNRITELIELLAAGAQSSQVILWEKRSLTATMLKKFPLTNALEFKASKTIFKWLDSLTGHKRNLTEQLRLLAESVISDGEVFCLTMLARQVRLLIQVLDSGQVKGPPFMISKLKRQTSTFTLAQLLKLHTQLLNLDRDLKTSQNRLSPALELDLLLMGM